MIQLFMKRSGSPAIVPLHFPASHDAMTEAVSRLDEASRTGKTEIVEIKSVIANLPSYLSGLDPDSRTQLAQLNQLSSIIAKMDSRERNIYAGALDGSSINDLSDMIRVAEQVPDYILIPNVNSDVTLGRYVAVAGQIQGDPRFPEAAWPYLDFAKIGAEYYADHGGAYTHAGYVLRKQDDALVREKKSKVQLDLSSAKAQAIVCLPATKEELERVKRTLGIDCFAEAAITRVSFSVPYMDEHMGETVIPPELQYVEVISVTASSGYDANTGEAVEDEKELPSTVTLLVTTEQAKVLAGLEQESELHLALVYRGAPENADEFIAAQDALIEELYAEPEAEAAEGAENAESAETEESEGADPAAESEAAGE